MIDTIVMLILYSLSSRHSLLLCLKNILHASEKRQNDTQNKTKQNIFGGKGTCEAINFTNNNEENIQK